MKTNHGGSTASFTKILTLIFVVLKFLNLISWSWVWVLSPLWISFLLFTVIFVLAALVQTL